MHGWRVGGGTLWRGRIGREARENWEDETQENLKGIGLEGLGEGVS